MCGIVGVLHKSPAPRSPLPDSALSRLAHRGPDGSGRYTDAHVQFGHLRLAIIDLTEGGHQPMTYANGCYVVTYNGEIYNYLELRTELEAIGEHFQSHSDTEVLLAAYRAWGRHCVKRFRGMFAFALWDSAGKTMFLARDRCGEKPLFFHRDGERLVFASELKGLLPLLGSRPALDAAVADMYLHYQYVPEPFTLLQGVRKLPAGHTMVVRPDDWYAEPKRYWTVEDISEPRELPDDMPSIVSCIRDSLEDAVRMTLRSDVPVAVALSGGLDSSAIAAFAQKNSVVPMHAFCVGYPGRPPYDERDQACRLAQQLGMIVHEVELPVHAFVDFFPELVRIMDEPIADAAAFGHYSVPKAAADRGIKVLLTGIGGDEIFWGYPWVTQTVSTNQALIRMPALRAIASGFTRPMARRLADRLAASSSVAVKGWTRTLLQIADMSNTDDQLLFYSAAPDFNDAFRLKSLVSGAALQGLSKDNPFSPTAIGRRDSAGVPAAVTRMLFDTWLASNCLSLGDRVSMAVSVETRLPFLDAKLIELVMALRAKTQDHKLGQKAWLRAALKGVLPDETLARPKAGFQPPVWEWLSGVVSKYGDALRGGALVHNGILSANKVERVLVEISREGWPGLFFSYKLLLLELWYQAIVVAAEPVEQPA